MNKKELIEAVKARIGTTSYSIWTVGVTDDTESRKGQHESDGENVKYWTHWKTDSEETGRDVEQHFLDLGMKGGAGGGGSAGYVYIF